MTAEPGTMPQPDCQGRRSDCPINLALETFGDKWSLLIVRDIVFSGRKTYNEFLKSEEGIATNVLASRLDLLEREGILRRAPHLSDRRKEVYTLTEKGLDLIPVLLEMADWSAKHAQTGAPKAFVARIENERDKLIAEIRDTVRAGGCVFSE
jgi:DNA-binding HxlR family transcriptional regulator